MRGMTWYHSASSQDWEQEMTCLPVHAEEVTETGTRRQPVLFMASRVRAFCSFSTNKGSTLREIATFFSNLFEDA